MNLSFRLIALSGVCVLMGACSTTHPTVAPAPAPAPTSTQTPAAAPAPAPGSTSASAPASGDTTNAAPKVKRLYLEDKTLTNDEVRRLFEQGYKPTSRNGEVYYCRKEAELGTRFAKTICRTADQMKQMEQQAKDLASEKQRPGGCTSQGASC
jgi:pyruvate/2-oxoglutarate dehydrogenase complex dihydrolipoamide acyltransferase (E2) component